MKNRLILIMRNILKRIQKGITYSLILPLVYLWSAQVSSLLTDLISPKITTTTQLEQLISTEREKVNPTNQSKIEIKLMPKNILYSGKATRLDNGNYIIEASFPYNEATIKHELYHIFRGHCDEIKDASKSLLQKGLKRIFYYEPTAKIYEVIGLQL